MYRAQDIQLSDINLKQQFIDYIKAGDIQQAKNVYMENAQLHGKCVNEDALNKVLTAILFLENVYDVNVTQNLQNNLNFLFNNIDNFKYVGEYNDTLPYKLNNFVLSGDDLLYNDGTQFINLGKKGKKGNPILGVNYVGRWHPKREYNKFDMISTSHELYVAKEVNINTNPLDNPNIWEKSLVLESPRINAVKIQADFDNLKVGDIYYEV